MPLPRPYACAVAVTVRNPLSSAFDPRLNGLNLLRLLLATGVIIHHSFLVLGIPITGVYAKLLQEGFVDGFFAISGYLIVSSWHRNPRWWPYLRARALRILPGFWVCLVVTAFILAPIGIALQGSGFPPGYWGDAAAFVARNLALVGFSYNIGPTPADLPQTDWNGSLWTLWWEFSCYLIVLVLGVIGALKRRWVIPGMFVLSLALILLTDAHLIGNFLFFMAARFGTMFFAGALIYQLRDRLPVRIWLVVAAAAIVFITAAFLPEYRLVAAIPLAYLLICLGALIKVPALRLRNDVSYGVYIYAFPVQQLLAIVGAGALGVPAFAVLSFLATLPLAVASWFLVERPALRLKMRGREPKTVQEDVVASVPGD